MPTKLLVCDMDGTLIKYGGRFQSSWDAVGKAAGKEKEFKKHLDYYLNKKELYLDWVKSDAGLLEGISVEEVKKQIFPIPYHLGVEEFLKNRPNYLEAGILSGGLDVVANQIQQELDLDFVVCTNLELENGKFTGKTTRVVNLWEKAELLQKLAKERGYSLSETCYVGDYKSDITCMKLLQEKNGLGIAFNHKSKELEEIADHIITDFRDLTEVLALN